MLLVQDRALLQAFREGARQALTAVFLHYSDGLASALRQGFTVERGGAVLRIREIANRHDLHDVIAETFRRAFEERARLAYSGLSPYSAYLRTIAQNIIVDRLRSKSSRWLALADEELPAADPAQPPPASPEADCRRKEVVALMQRFLAELSAEQRSLVELRFHEELSQQDAARRLTQSRRWVRKQEVEIRRRLVRFLGASGYLPHFTEERRRELLKHTP